MRVKHFSSHNRMKFDLWYYCVCRHCFWICCNCYYCYLLFDVICCRTIKKRTVKWTKEKNDARIATQNLLWFISFIRIYWIRGEVLIIFGHQFCHSFRLSRFPFCSLVFRFGFCTPCVPVAVQLLNTFIFSAQNSSCFIILFRFAS